jgi:hypothetical protein
MKKIVSLLLSIFRSKNFKKEERFFSYKYNGKTLFYERCSEEDNTLSKSEVMIVSPEFVEWSTGHRSYTSYTKTEAYHTQVLGDVEIPSQVVYKENTYSVVGISKLAFHNCESLTSIIMPPSVVSIDNWAFMGCVNLTNIDLSPSIVSIGRSAFKMCSSLSSIKIPASVTSLDNNVFCSCSSLNSIVVDTENPKYDSRDNCNAIIETSTNTLIAGCKNTALPSSITSIGDRSFEGCKDLINISMPSLITSIGHAAFHGCSSLVDIVLPPSLVSIGSDAFKMCSSLTEIETHSTLDYIGENAFSFCSSLKNITIDANQLSDIDSVISHCESLISITLGSSINAMTQTFKGCPNIKTIFLQSINPPTYFENEKIQIIAKDVPRSIMVFVPKGKLSVYQRSWYWKDFNLQEYDFSTDSCKNENETKNNLI